MLFKYYDTLKSKSKNEVRHYKKYFNEIMQPDNITYPINVEHDIYKFEKLNNLKINVYILNEKEELEIIYSDNENKRPENK